MTKTSTTPVLIPSSPYLTVFIITYLYQFVVFIIASLAIDLKVNNDIRTSALIGQILNRRTFKVLNYFQSPDF